MLNTTTFQQSLQRLNDDYQKVTFLVAVSGGADSMVLLNLFKLSDLQFQVAHINYGLRGSNSDKDQKLVEKVCEKNEIPFHLIKYLKKIINQKIPFKLGRGNYDIIFLEKFNKKKI